MIKSLSIIMMSIQSVIIIRRLSTQSVQVSLKELITQPIYLTQLMVAGAFILSIILILSNKKIWWIPSSLGLILAQYVIISNWQDLKLLTIINIIIFILVLVGYFAWSFNLQISSEISELIQREDYSKELVKYEDLNDLPKPVKRWLEKSNIVGKEHIESVYLEQKGLLRLDPDQKWLEATAKQYFDIVEPAFLWTVETEMNNIPIVGRDLFYKGKGEILIKLASVFPVANEKDHPKLNEATLQRYLGEIVWFPSAALSDNITWEEIDDFSAKAIMTYEGVRGEATFYFNQNYELDKFLALRYKDVKDEKRTLWQAKVIEIGEFNGIKIPIKLEASWLLQDNEEFMWYQFEITNIKYNNKGQ